MALFMGGCSLFGISTTEEAKFKVIDKEGHFQVRLYEPVMIARVTVKADNFQQAARAAFDPLYKYISGANIRQQKVSMTIPVLTEREPQTIKMTTPVIVAAQDDPKIWEVAFVLPADFTLENTPKPTNPEVVVKWRDDLKVAVVKFSGKLNPKTETEYQQKLEAWIKTQGYTSKGTAIVAAYNPPWTLPMFRRNEVQIPIE